MSHGAQRSTRPEAAGLVIHGAERYDLLVALFTLGGERRFRRKMLQLAELQPGETVLDLGCGTGTLAIEAKRVVGKAGVVHGVDASPEMIARAQEKARSAQSEVIFTQAAAQMLPLADGSVDVVLSTLMLHHLPKKARPEIAREIRRVLKSGGRFLAVDFAKPVAAKRNLMDRFHRHGFIKLEDFIPELEAAGLNLVRNGEVGERNLHYVLASAGPNVIGVRDANIPDSTPSEACEHDQERNEKVSKHGHSRGLLIGLALAAALILVVMHAGLALTLYRMLAHMTLSPMLYTAIGALALIVVLSHLFGGRLIAHLVRARHLVRYW